MRYSHSIPLFFAILLILKLSSASDVYNTAENQEDVLLHVMDQESRSQLSPVEEYLNHSLTEEVLVTPIYPSTPSESRSIWLGSNNKSMDDSIYQDLMDVVWIQYMEDLNYSSYVLDEFVNKNISGMEAMASTTSLFTLTSQTVDLLDKIKPPSKFMQYHNTTLDAMINLEGYLWNMAKFYESNRRVYAIQAHENFNESMSSYETALDISAQLKRA